MNLLSARSMSPVRRRCAGRTLIGASATPRSSRDSHFKRPGWDQSTRRPTGMTTIQNQTANMRIVIK